MIRNGRFLALGLSLVVNGCALVGSGHGHLPPDKAVTTDERQGAIRRARVWSPTNIRSLNLKAGPAPRADLSPDKWLTCEYQQAHGGHSRKFDCQTKAGEKLRVKYGEDNREVYGLVLTSRLFWALGFPVDNMYPVRVHCVGCSPDPWEKPEKTSATTDFDPATIVVRRPGRLMETKPDSGWDWDELDLIDPGAVKDARATRDALKLLAAFVQHTDSKPANQVILCPRGAERGAGGCRTPLLVVSDLGLTFGRSNMMNKAVKGGVHFERWSATPVWKDGGRCEAELPGSFTGTLKNPRISEAGRAFLARLLVQLSDVQIHDLFATARVDLVPRDGSDDGPPASVDEWAQAFKRKRAEIVNARCPQ